LLPPFEALLLEPLALPPPPLFPDDVVLCPPEPPLSATGFGTQLTDKAAAHSAPIHDEILMILSQG
jgi:hypothetical protein